MDNNIVDRIKQIIEESSFNQKDFCEYCEVNPSTLSSVLKGKTGVTLPLVMSIHKAFGQYSLEWILKGEGSVPNLLPLEGDKFPPLAEQSSVEKAASVSMIDSPLFASAAITSGAGCEQTAIVSSSIVSKETTVEITPEAIEMVKYIERPPRQVVEIRVFFDDGTYQVLAPQG